MLDMQFVRLGITLVYGTKEFREDLKAVTQIAGVEDRDVVLVLDDSDIVSERCVRRGAYCCDSVRRVV